MTIKEMETRTGLPRANIRYYENEGLIHPSRGDNGYRNYSQEDLNTLLKIKLLRQVGFSLEEIAALQQGDLQLEPALAGRITGLEQEQVSLSRSASLCRSMQEDHVCYPTLDAPLYLERLEHVQELSFPWKEDRLPQRCFPWRRYFARTLDLYICLFLYYVFLSVAFRINILNRTGFHELLDGLISMVILLFVEPLCLHLWGRTPGKALFGLHLARSDGSPLSYKEGFSRTAGVLFLGCGLQIPVFTTITLILSLWNAYHKDALPWQSEEEAYTEGSTRERSYWGQPRSYLRLVGVAALLLCMILCLYRAYTFAMTPRNQGDNLTVEQFVENYNQLTRFQADSEDQIYALTTDGTFQYPAGTTSLSVLYPTRRPAKMSFTTDGDRLTAVSIHYEDKRQNVRSTGLPTQEITNCIWSFLYGRGGLSQRQITELMEQLEVNPSESFTWKQNLASVQYQTDIQGYEIGPYTLTPDKTAERSILVNFTVELP